MTCQVLFPQDSQGEAGLSRTRGEASLDAGGFWPEPGFLKGRGHRQRPGRDVVPGEDSKGPLSRAARGVPRFPRGGPPRGPRKGLCVEVGLDWPRRSGHVSQDTRSLPGAVVTWKLSRITEALLGSARRELRLQLPPSSLWGALSCRAPDRPQPGGTPGHWDSLVARAMSWAGGTEG